MRVAPRYGLPHVPFGKLSSSLSPWAQGPEPKAGYSTHWLATIRPPVQGLTLRPRAQGRVGTPQGLERRAHGRDGEPGVVSRMVGEEGLPLPVAYLCLSADRCWWAGAFPACWQAGTCHPFGRPFERCPVGTEITRRVKPSLGLRPSRCSGTHLWQLVGKEGLEPSRDYSHTLLKRTRIPVPPLAQQLPKIVYQFRHLPPT